MRFRAVYLIGFASACASCVPPPVSNGAKLGEALAFAATAGAIQVAQAAMEQHARNTAPVAHSGLAASAGCDNEDQYACATVSAASATAPAPAEPEMTVEDVREYVLGYVNGVRKLNGVPPIVRDPTLDAFAQAGSEELARDHLPRQHILRHAAELGSESAEIQGPSDGSGSGSLQDRIAVVLVDAMREGPGGPRHDALLRREWQKLGVGVSREDGRTYFTADFSP